MTTETHLRLTESAQTALADRLHPAAAILLAHDWRRSLMARAIARAFTPPPDKEIWDWADENVVLQNEDAAEPGNYRSAKTPWTRRLQELMRRPEMWVWSFTAGRYVRVAVTEINVMKSSQSGYSEGCLNGIRWRASYRPCNTIYAIDSADEAKKIARRLLRSLRFLDSSIFTGDPDDIKTLEFQLRGMELLFYGSFSTGKFANKQAALNINDEVEEHGKNILADSASRKKTTRGGLQINLSKPKLKNGPIHKAFLRGNQEQFFVPCPHCGHLQYFTFFPEEREVPFSEEFVWVNTETGENFDADPNLAGGEHISPITAEATRENNVVAPRCAESRDECPVAGQHFLRLPKPLPLGEKRKLRTGRFVFEHCKNLLGEWDRLRVQTETYYECAGCQGRIENHHKRWMIDRGQWLPTELSAMPGIVSQQMSDYYSEDEMSAFGQIANEYIEARNETHIKGAVREEGITPLQKFYNHRGGKVWSEEAGAVEEKDITANIAGRALWFVDGPNAEGQLVRNVFTDQASADRLAAANQERGEETPVILSACPPFKRGTIPFVPRAIVGGSDIGGSYARWVALAIHQNLLDAAVIDWGEELDPDAIMHFIRGKRWPVAGLGYDPTRQQHRMHMLFMDARHAARDVYEAAIASKGQIIPCMGSGGAVATSIKLWGYNQVSTYPRLRQLVYNDQRAKSALYLERIKRKRRRLWWPVDVEEDPRHIDELTAERQQPDRRGRLFWPDTPEGPNHDGDCAKLAVLGIDFLTASLSAPRGRQTPRDTSAAAE